MDTPQVTADLLADCARLAAGGAGRARAGPSTAVGGCSGCRTRRWPNACAPCRCLNPTPANSRGRHCAITVLTWIAVESVGRLRRRRRCRSGTRGLRARQSLRASLPAPRASRPPSSTSCALGFDCALRAENSPDSHHDRTRRRRHRTLDAEAAPLRLVAVNTTARPAIPTANTASPATADCPRQGGDQQQASDQAADVTDAAPRGGQRIGGGVGDRVIDQHPERRKADHPTQIDGGSPGRRRPPRARSRHGVAPGGPGCTAASQPGRSR